MWPVSSWHPVSKELKLQSDVLSTDMLWHALNHVFLPTTRVFFIPMLFWRHHSQMSALPVRCCFLITLNAKTTFWWKEKHASCLMDVVSEIVAPNSYFVCCFVCVCVCLFVMHYLHTRIIKGVVYSLVSEILRYRAAAKRVSASKEVFYYAILCHSHEWRWKILEKLKERRVPPLSLTL